MFGGGNQCVWRGVLGFLHALSFKVESLDALREAAKMAGIGAGSAAIFQDQRVFKRYKAPNHAQAANLPAAPDVARFATLSGQFGGVMGSAQNEYSFN